MRALQRSRALRLLLAFVLSGGTTLLAWRAGILLVCLLLFLAVTLLVYAALSVAPDAIALQQGHHWRWWWRSSDDEGPFWPGPRIPRGSR